MPRSPRPWDGLQLPARALQHDPHENKEAALWSAILQEALQTSCPLKSIHRAVLPVPGEICPVRKPG